MRAASRLHLGQILCKLPGIRFGVLLVVTATATVLEAFRLYMEFLTHYLSLLILGRVTMSFDELIW